MIANWLNYEINNIFGFVLFLLFGWLATKSDIVKDILALGLLAILLVPVSYLVVIYYSHENWFGFIFCSILQIGLAYLAYIFIKYMYTYHKDNKYIFWEK